MPIINSYSVIGTGGGTGGTSNSEPYPFSIVTIISIPANEKFLLVPGKEHPREITLGFTEPIDLYFGNDEVSFKSISVGERFRDTQLGVDLWVKSSVTCEALVIIRSTEIINYIGSETPQQPLITILNNGQNYIIDSTQADPINPTGFYAYIDNPEAIPLQAAWQRFQAPIPAVSFFTLQIENGSNPSLFPTIDNPFYWEFVIYGNHEGYFQLAYYAGEDEIYQPLIIKSFDETTKTFIVGI